MNSRSLLVTLLILCDVSPLRSQASRGVESRGDSLTIRLVDVELRTAIQALAPYLDRPVITLSVPPARVSIETPSPIARGDVARLLFDLLSAHGAEAAMDSASRVYRIRVREPARVEPQPMPLTPSLVGLAPPELFVIRLRHAKAAEVAATVNALYGRASAVGELGDLRAPLSRELTRQQIGPAGVTQPPPAHLATRGAALGTETVIVPDSRANSLLVRAPRADFELIQAAVAQVDVRPLQVLIEVLIAEVRRDRSLDIGLEASLPETPIAKTENTTIEAQLSPAQGLGDLAAKLMGISGLDVEATIRAAESRGNARLINRPILFAANNERAEINVGSQRPFVQVARVLPTDNTARDQVIQYKDVGTRLSIVPTISFEGYVMLQVVQEVNAATAEQQFNAPVISTRSVETRLLVRDGQTVVLGGLTDSQRESVRTGVPFLSRLPLLGILFGRDSRRRADTELLLFITPRLVRDDNDADAVTGPLRRRADRIQR